MKIFIYKIWFSLIITQFLIFMRKILNVFYKIINWIDENKIEDT